MDTAGPIYHYSFCIGYVHAVLSAATKKPPRAIRLISHAPPVLGKMKYSMDSSRQYLLSALINTAEIELYLIAVAALQRAPQGEETRKKKDGYSRPRRKRSGIILNYFSYFISFFYMRRY